jgi:predicted lipoprotein with Yx(FWY)xxD motif
MSRTTSITFFASLAALPLAAVALAGCGSGGGSASASSPTTASGGPATVGAENRGLGKILVNSHGRTLYLFKKDTATKSACVGACAGNWPPLRVSGNAAVGTGLKASLLGSTKRSDGEPQVTYNGHPLYLFGGDTSAGKTSGQGVKAFGDFWYVVSSAGNQNKATPGPTPGFVYGYGY